MTDQIVTIVPIGEVNTLKLEYIAHVIEHTFKFSTQIVLNYKVDALLQPVLGRINSSKVLSLLSKSPILNTYRILAITEYDLYSPIFSVFFGEAQLNGQCAIVSLHRLRQQYYNITEDGNIFLSRCEKVVIHEIAHTIGLVHCENSHCVMYSAGSMAGIDMKSSFFCSECNGTV